MHPVPNGVAHLFGLDGNSRFLKIRGGRQIDWFLLVQNDFFSFVTKRVQNRDLITKLCQNDSYRPAGSFGLVFGPPQISKTVFLPLFV